MKKLFLSAILSVGLISSAIAMDGEELKITRNRIDFENSQFIEFSDLIGYKNQEDAKNGVDGTKIGICCAINQGYSYHIIEDKFKQEDLCINKYNSQVNLKSQKNLSNSDVSKDWQNFESLSTEEKAESLTKMKAEFKVTHEPLGNAFKDTNEWTIAAINYLASLKAYSNEDKIIFKLCYSNINTIKIMSQYLHTKSDNTAQPDSINNPTTKDKLVFATILLASPLWVAPAWVWFLLGRHPHECGNVRGMKTIALLGATGFAILEVAALVGLGFTIKKYAFHK